MKYRRTWAILGILATIIWLLLRPSESEAVASKKAASSSTSRAAPLRTGMEKPERHSQAAESQGQHHQHFSRHDANQLKDFILPHLDGKEVSLREALDLLHEAYLEACFHSQEKPLALKFTIKDEPDRPISFSLRGRSFLTCLNHLAALSGLLVERNELSFELFRSETADHPRDIVFRYGPHTKERLRTQAGLKPEGGDEDWETLLRSVGLIQEADTRLSISGDSLKVSGTHAEVARVQSGIAVANAPPVQFQISTKLLSVTSPVKKPQAAVNEGELQTLIHDLSQQPGTQLTNYPSTVMREGEAGTIQIIQTTEGNESNWTGATGTYQAERTGFKITIHDRLEFRPHEAKEPAWLGETNSAVSYGDSHLQLMSARNGVYQYRILTVTAMDATGEPLVKTRSAPATQ